MTMTIGRIAWLAGIAVLVLVVNVGISILYMVFYSYLLDPGHDQPYDRNHIQIAAPYSSIIAGMPLMFLAGWWVGGWWEGEFAIKAGLTIWVAYALIDITFNLASGLTTRIAILAAISLATKLAAVYLGSLVVGRRA